MRFSLTVSRLTNDAGQYTQLADNSILQTYIQIINPEKPEIDTQVGFKYYDNYTSTIKFIPSDYGKVLPEKYLD